MNSWSVWGRGADGRLVSRGFGDFNSAVSYAAELGSAFVALEAPNCAGIVHIWEPLRGEEE